MFLPIAALTIATALVFAVPAAHSTPITFGTILSGPNEVPHGANATDNRVVFRLDDARHRGAHPLLRTTRQETYLSPVFDLTQSLIYNAAFVTLEGGLPQAEAALIAGIEGGMTDFNIHTTANMGGALQRRV